MCVPNDNWILISLCVGYLYYTEILENIYLMHMGLMNTYFVFHEEKNNISINFKRDFISFSELLKAELLSSRIVYTVNIL